MRILCRLGFHRWSEALELPSAPWVRSIRQTCEAEGCSKEYTAEGMAPGWVSERVCQDVYCSSDSDHSAHTEWQVQRIKVQRNVMRRHKAAATG